jgi:peptidoglycan/LPS O-acetylase OafA/YrhL
MFAFFTGGLTFFLARFLLARGTGKTTMRVLVALCVVAWIATAMSVKLSFFAHLTAWLQQMQLFGLSDRMIASLCSHASNKAIVGALFPLTILSLVLVEAQRGSCGKRIAFLGHVSYSSYLLHFPLQLFIVTMFAHLNWSITVFQQGWSLVAFYSVLIPLSILVFRFYESPAQAILRRLLLPKRPQDCLNGTHSERPVWEGH